MAALNAPPVVPDPQETVPTEESTEENKKRELKDKYADMRLHQIVPNDEMYFLMENFLLGDPERQIPELGDPTSLITKGDDDRKNGDNLMARADYETGAKVAIYQQKLDQVEKCLTLASTVTDPNNEHYKLQKGILNNLSEVMRLAKEYYTTIPKTDEL